MTRESSMGSTYLILAGLCLAGLMIRNGYELLKKAGRVDAENKVIFVVVFAAMCAMLVSWPLMCAWDPRRMVVPRGVRWVGLGMAAAGFALAIGGMVQLRGVENIAHLVTTGLYSRLRHPMYTGFILWIIGWAAAYGPMTSPFVGVVCIGSVLYWRNLEECAMESRYADDYRAYRRETWC